jgi:tetratricopeptide (TPR) repeat protein
MLKRAVILFLLLVAGCAQSYYVQGRKHVEAGKYEQAIDLLYKEIQVNPTSYKAWRELGVAFYNKGDLIKAEDAFKQANNIQPDARTNLYMGMIFEQRRQYDKAIASYSASLNLKTEGKTREMIRSRLGGLITKKIEADALTAIENEAAIDVDTIPQNSIAVVDFDGSQLPDDIAPISKGLAEFTAIDLAKVSDLRVVDRLKLDAIMSELKLSASKYADPNFAPRMGRLVGSRQIITGTVLSSGDDMIRLDGAIVNATDSTTELTEPTEGELEKFFKLQKDFVFSVIDSLGIELTREERDAIEEVPTESFLAFMAYCRGLNYQSMGMIDAARQQYQQAAKEDKSFGLPTAKLQDPSMAAAEESFESFELSVTSESKQEEEYTGLDRTQRETLFNSDFIWGRDIYNRYGNSPIRPPDVTDVYIIVNVRGDLDAY